MATIEQAEQVVSEADAALARLADLPLNYTEREIVAGVRGVLAVAAAALALAAQHEHVAPEPPPARDPVQVTITPPASAPDGGPAA